MNDNNQRNNNQSNIWGNNIHNQNHRYNSTRKIFINPTKILALSEDKLKDLYT